MNLRFCVYCTLNRSLRCDSHDKVLRESLTRWCSCELVTIIDLVMNSGDAKAMVTHLWKVAELREQHYKKIKQESTN
jgi:hypothetical protein